MTLRYPNLPCATFGTTRKTSVPLELLHIVEAQRVPRERMGVANEDSMIKAIAVDPQTRRDRIQAAVDKLAAAPEKVFGMRFNRELLQVPGRILPLPTVMYANGLYAPTNPKDGPSMLNGGWNMIGRQLMEAKPLRNWIFLNTTRNPSRSDVKILAFLGELMNQLKVLGLQSDQPIVEDLGNAPIQQKLLQLCENVRCVICEPYPLDLAGLRNLEQRSLKSFAFCFACLGTLSRGLRNEATMLTDFHLSCIHSILSFLSCPSGP